MKQYVTGLHKVINNFRVVGRVTEARIVEAVEVTSVEVTNHARAGHEKGAHASGRYENQTTLLTQSTQPTDAEVKKGAIVGSIIANREYAKDVELGTPHSRAYPFMYPALTACAAAFQSRLKAAVKSKP